MNELTEIAQFIPSKADIEELQHHLLKFPQAELETEHYFSDSGMYCRKLFRPEGTIIVGKVHKQSHLFICAMGEIKVWTESGIKILKAGDVVETQPGTKRVTLALTDAIGITVHRTNKTDLDEIEKELIEEDESAAFDSRNLPKPLPLIVKSLQEDSQ